MKMRKTELGLEDVDQILENDLENSENQVIADTEMLKHKEESSSRGSTPKQRKNLFQLFGIVSPFLRKKVPTEEEVRRFSLAVHLWAGRVHGGVEFLQNTRLTDRHFKDILIFAGPSSKWKLIPDRSITQYRNLWQNAFKGKQFYHGDEESGFENESKLHEASLSVCPFGHCKLSADLMEITCDNNREKNSFESKAAASSRRKLFTPEKNRLIEDQRQEKPSPSKQELKEENQILKQKIESIVSTKNVRLLDACARSDKKESIFTQPKLVKCQQVGCHKTFVTVFGLEQHMKVIHADIKDIKKIKQECPFCGKATFYVDQHIKSAHKEMSKNDTCEVCQQKIKQDMKKHRSVCISCPFCGYQNKKKDRLLKHIERTHRENGLQTKALDLTSPRKKEISTPIENHSEIVETNNENTQSEPLNLTSPCKDSNPEDTDLHSQIGSAEAPLDLSPSALDDNKNEELVPLEKLEVGGVAAEDFVDTKGKKTQHPEHESLDLEKVYKIPRINFPFDDTNDPYQSEFEDGDDMEFTLNRREVKDELEKELRIIDELKTEDTDGDAEVLDQFETFMKNKTKRGNEEGGYLSEVSTVGTYKRALKNDLLPAFHKLFEPFDSRWILDCTTHKECTFDGEKRFYMKPEEPIYITSKVVQTALDLSKAKGGQQGGQRGTILNATIQFMNFIEIFFNEKLNVYGRDPYENVVMYHQGVRTFISGTGAWKMCNDEKDKAQNENKVRQSYEHPNKEVEVLQRYKQYIKSPSRLKNLNKILIHSENEEKRPSDRQMTELGKIAMGEIVAATGCRPVVLLKLTTGAYVDKQPGFNPYNTSKDDCIVDEQDGNDKIFRRVNPNLPPKHKACQHQLEGNIAECPVMCAERCIPDGYNLYITWDKTSGSKGPSYLHIPKELKHMMDIYDIKRIRYFKGRTSPFSQKEDWIHEDSTPFFLNSACSPFKSLDLKHLAEAMGIHVTAYSHRKIVATWALSHASEEIRSAEQDALQHSLKVANDKYKQNKQINPQKLTQKYVEEEGLFPEAFCEDIEETQNKVKSVIKTTEDQRTKKRIETLVKRNEAYEILKSDNRPLGPNHRVLATKRKEFMQLLQVVSDKQIDNCMREIKPLQWRQFCVRTVCTAKEMEGEKLRKLWAEMYQGDLRWGIRDVRQRAKENNWPMIQLTRRRDRSSWIAACIRQSQLTEMKKQEKKKGKQLEEH